MNSLLLCARDTGHVQAKKPGATPVVAASLTPQVGVLRECPGNSVGNVCGIAAVPRRLFADSTSFGRIGDVKRTEAAQAHPVLRSRPLN